MTGNHVYVVQNQHWWNRKTQQFEQKFDISSAKRFGELTYLLSPTASPFRPAPVIDDLKRRLFSYGPGDFLLLIGNPVLIGFAVAIAADANDGEVSMLQWSGKDQRYIRVDATGLFTSID